MGRFALVALSFVALIGCQGRSANVVGQVLDERRADKQYREVTIDVQSSSSNIEIGRYVLITDDVEADRKEAEAIMRMRENMPLAVQTKDAALFDRILAKDYTFRAADEFWNRAQYIRNRVEETETVGMARYENVVLQLFGNVALSTYRNAVKVTAANGEAETLLMSWASVYVKENDGWRIRAHHLIDKRSVAGARQ